MPRGAVPGLIFTLSFILLFLRSRGLGRIILKTQVVTEMPQSSTGRCPQRLLHSVARHSFSPVPSAWCRPVGLFFAVGRQRVIVMNSSRPDLPFPCTTPVLGLCRGLASLFRLALLLLFAAKDSGCRPHSSGVVKQPTLGDYLPSLLSGKTVPSLDTERAAWLVANSTFLLATSPSRPTTPQEISSSVLRHGMMMRHPSVCWSNQPKEGCFSPAVWPSMPGTGVVWSNLVYRGPTPVPGMLGQAGP